MKTPIRLLRRAGRRALPVAVLVCLGAAGISSASSALTAPPTAGVDAIAAVQPALPPVFVDVEPAAVKAVAGQTAHLSPETTLRSRYVRVNAGAFQDMATNGSLRLNLFDGIETIAVRSEAGEVFGDGFAWIGSIPGEQFSSVIFASVNDVTVGNIVTGLGDIYELRYVGNGIHYLRQVDQSQFPPEAPPIPISLGAAATDAAEAGSVLAPQTDDSSRLDIMVVYSDDARAAAGGGDAMRAEVYLGVMLTNQSYVDSNVTQRLSLVHVAEIAYAETGNSSTDLSRLQNSGDGQIDNVHTLRNRYGADLVSFWVDSLDYCGRGYVMQTVSAAFASYAFNVVDRECAGSNLSFAHELGHNMGALHDWYEDDGTTPYAYAHGFINVAARWRTIMAYNSECAAQSPAVNCTRVGHWSNPNINHSGNPTGVASGTTTACTAGNLSNPNCDADNRQVLNNTRATIANFRDTSPERNDVWMKDTWEDTGAQPDPLTVSQDMWQSPYLWVRTSQDADLVHQHEHQNPEQNETNYIYAKLHNGSNSSVSGTLRFYWANASTGLAWPADWTEFDSVAVTIGANTSQVYEAKWTPAGLGHYCLLARWESASDPMAHAEGASVSTNVRNNNNIVWKNVEIVPGGGPDCRPVETTFIVRNVGNLKGKPVEMIHLLLQPEQGGHREWMRRLSILLKPGKLMAKWHAMEGFERIDEETLRLADPEGGRLLGIPLEMGEPYEVRIIFTGECKELDTRFTEGFDMMQVALGDEMPVGGVTYKVVLDPRPDERIQVQGGKFDDRDGDGLWDEKPPEPGLPQWEIRFTNAKTGAVTSAYTDSMGRYAISLPPGEYIVKEVDRPGWIRTTPQAGQYNLSLAQAAEGGIFDINFGNRQQIDTYMALIMLRRR